MILTKFRRENALRVLSSGLCLILLGIGAALAAENETPVVSLSKSVSPASARNRISPPPLDDFERAELAHDAALLPVDNAKANSKVDNDVSKSIPPENLQHEKFSNACTPPRSRPQKVPKSLRDLREQMGEDFQIARRGEFLVASDVDTQEFRTLVDGVLACCHEYLVRDYFDAKGKKAVTVYVFRDERSYAAHLRLLFNMEPISPYGHYGHSQRYIVVNYDTGPGTLVHELTHALMAPDFPQAPIWVSEGIASLYEQCRVEEDTLKGDPNWRLPELLDALANKTVTPLDVLLGLSVRNFRRDHESLHYAESRYFCKYMEEKGVLRKFYHLFRDGYSQDNTGLKFVLQAFGKSLPEVESGWHSWLRAQKWDESQNLAETAR
jgi:hypothetical protein